MLTDLVSGLFSSHRADPDGPPIELGPLDIVNEGGDWVIALDNYDAFYAHMDPDGRGPFEVDPSDNSDYCLDCEVYFDGREGTGRTYCGCGFWYDRSFWGL